MIDILKSKIKSDIGAISIFVLVHRYIRTVSILQ